MALTVNERRYGSEVRDLDGRLVTAAGAGGAAGYPPAAPGFAYAAGTVAGPVTPLAAVLREVSVLAGDVDAGIALDTGDTIVVPAGAGISIRPDMGGSPPVDIVGGGAGMSWYVAYSD